MDQFVRSRNVERYHRLLERVTEESDRQQIINLLAEERQKQKDAGDCRNVKCRARRRKEKVGSSDLCRNLPFAGIVRPLSLPLLHIALHLNPGHLLRRP
jgi:hypothetical protein